jgi:hypothetical protein
MRVILQSPDPLARMHTMTKRQGKSGTIDVKSEQDDLRDLIAPALKGLTRGGASVQLITVIPGGFLLHLSSGVVISLAHNYLWDKGSESKEAIFAALKRCLSGLSSAGAQGDPACVAS